MSNNQYIIARDEMLKLGPSKRKDKIFGAIGRERKYQDNKWGTIENHPHEIPGWLLIMESELNEAKEAWVHNGGNVEALKEILQVVSTGVACLEQHGIIERTRSGKGIERVPR